MSVDELCETRFGDDFASWRRGQMDDIEFLNDLASKKGVVLMYGPGFEAPEGAVRISLAYLDKDDYVAIARRMDELLGEYHKQFEQETALPAAA